MKYLIRDILVVGLNVVVLLNLSSKITTPYIYILYNCFLVLSSIGLFLTWSSFNRFLSLKIQPEEKIITSYDLWAEMTWHDFKTDYLLYIIKTIIRVLITVFLAFKGMWIIFMINFIHEILVNSIYDITNRYCENKDEIITYWRGRL